MHNKERIYTETGYACAYCGVGGSDNLSIDHIDGRLGKDANKYDNLIALCYNCHHKKTTNRGITSSDLKKIKKVLIKRTLTPFGVNALKLASRNGFGVAATPFLLTHLVEMGLLKIEEEISSYGNLSESRKIVTEARFEITEEGERIYHKWLA